MSPYTWKCPYCGQNATIDDKNEKIFQNDLLVSYSEKWKNKDNDMSFFTKIITCPNLECQNYSLEIFIYKAEGNRHWNYIEVDENEKIFHYWRLLPSSMAKVLPDYIPEHVKQDYEEACAILNSSPKASATLARRCLQGMIRDYWTITNKKSLHFEIEELKNKGVDSDIIDTLLAFKSIGNIGAHPEKDNTIIDVEPDEAKKLIEMLEMLFEDWYIERENRKNRLNSIKQINQTKQSQKNSQNGNTNNSNSAT